MDKACECGALTTSDYPVWCPTCSTFTHPAYVRKWRFATDAEAKAAGDRMFAKYHDLMMRLAKL